MHGFFSSYMEAIYFFSSYMESNKNNQTDTNDFQHI